ncbi:MAG: ComF family protein [Chloroflexi bacterium]|nr:ComF family protein [Chloroflexota bacterium]
MEGAVRAAVHALKYQNLRALAPTLGQLLGSHILEIALPADLVVPVALHTKRQRSRGYNQSLLLAQEAGRVAGLPVAEGALRRIRHTPAQAQRARQEERWANVADAFEAEVGCVKDRGILLIDDVCTTGATLEACSLALKQAGASRVWGVALAREV